MNLSQALRLTQPICLALVGAGGKTTALFQLARQLPPPVIVTATTHLHVDQIRLADAHWIGDKSGDLAGLAGALDGVVLVTGPVEGDRTTGLNIQVVDWLREFCDARGLPLLVEADGSRRHPLKAPGEQEPPIPASVGTVVIVAGISGLGQPLSEAFVHRPDAFARLSGLVPGQPVTPEALTRVLTHPDGGLKNIPAQARRVALLNQADTPGQQSQAKAVAEKLFPSYHAVIIASLQEAKIHAVYEPTAGIILAAGESRRFGRSKQLLDYHGKPFVQVVAGTALSAGLSPVVVVTGANAAEVEGALSDLPITISHNSNWQSGQSSSIRAGLAGLPPQMGAALFLLADQPQVTPAIIRALVEQHTLGLAPVIAPRVGDRRANPVLFDRITFPDLMALTGDVGGRAIFSKYPVTYLPWQDESLLLDVDTPEDYRKIDANGQP